MHLAVIAGTFEVPVFPPARHAAQVDVNNQVVIKIPPWGALSHSSVHRNISFHQNTVLETEPPNKTQPWTRCRSQRRKRWAEEWDRVVFPLDLQAASSQASPAISLGLKMTWQPMRSAFNSDKVSCHPSPRLYGNMASLTISDQARGSRLMNRINKAPMYRSTFHLQCHCSELNRLEEKLSQGKTGRNWGFCLRKDIFELAIGMHKIVPCKYRSSMFLLLLDTIKKILWWGNVYERIFTGCEWIHSREVTAFSPNKAQLIYNP